MSFKKCLLASVCSAMAVLSLPQTSHALKILPPRVVMKSGENLAYVYVKNDSPTVKSYAFGWRHFAMSKDGEVKRITEENAGDYPDYRRVDPYIRYSPRRTTIQPGQTQRVTLFARRPQDLPDGEYRSHFVVERLPDPVTKSNDVGDADGAKVGVTVLVSRSFPVYMHHGDVQAEVAVKSARFLRGDKKNKKTGKAPFFVEVDFEKTGNRSVIGRIDVMCGDEPIHNAHKLFSVYAEADRSSEQVLLDESKARACAQPRVVVKGHADDLFAGQLLGEIPISK